MSSRGGQQQAFDPFFAEVDTEVQPVEVISYGQSRMAHTGQQPLVAQQQPRPLHSVAPFPVDAWTAWASNNGSTITGSYQYGDQEQQPNCEHTTRDEQLFVRDPAESPTYARHPSTNTSPAHLALSTKQDGPSKGGIGSGHSQQNCPNHHQQEGQQQQKQHNDNKEQANNHEGSDNRSVCSEDADGSSYAGTPPLEPQFDSKLIIVSDKKWSLTAAAAVSAPVAEDAHQQETEHHSLTDMDDKQNIDPLTQLALVATSGAMRPTLISSKRRAPARDSSSKKKKKKKTEKTVARIAPLNEPPSSSFVPQISATELLKDQDSEEDLEARGIRAELERKADLDFEQDMFEHGQRERNRQPCIIEGVNEVMTPSKAPFGQLQATAYHMRMFYKELVKENPEGDKSVADASSTSHGGTAYPTEQDNTSCCCSNRESTAQDFLASGVQQRSAVDSRDTAKSTSGPEEANVPRQSSSQECFSFLTFDDTPDRINSGRCSDIKVFDSLYKSPASSPLISQEDVPEDVPEMALTPQTTSSGAEEKGCASREEVEYGTRSAEREVCETAEVDTRSEIATEEMPTTPRFSQDTSSTAFSMQPRQFCDIATQTDTCACNGLVAGRVYSKKTSEAQKGLGSHLAPKHEGLSLASPYVCVPSDRASEPLYALSNVVPLDLSDVLLALPELVERRGPTTMHPPAAGTSEPATQLLPSSSSSETDAMAVDAGLKVAELRFQLSATPPPTGSHYEGHCESMLPSPTLEKDFDILLPKVETVIDSSSAGTGQATIVPAHKEVARVMKRSVSGANKFHKVLAEMPEEDREVACLAMMADSRDTSISLRRRKSRSAENLQQNADESKMDAAIDNRPVLATQMPKSSQKGSKRARIKDEEDDVADTDQMSANVANRSAKKASITDTNALSTAKDPSSMTKQTREGPLPARRKRLTNLPPFQRNLRSRK